MQISQIKGTKQITLALNIQDERKNLTSAIQLLHMMYILFNYMYNDFIVNALKYFYIYLQYYFFIFFFFCTVEVFMSCMAFL